jgi:hypothetical protein
MARMNREEVFAPDEIAIVHVMNRVVRRCFLMGIDPDTGIIDRCAVNEPFGELAP